MIQICIRPRPLDPNKDLQDITAILSIDEFNENDKLGRCVFSIREILDIKCSDLPERAFMMAGTIEYVREKAKSLAKRA